MCFPFRFIGDAKSVRCLAFGARTHRVHKTRSFGNGFAGPGFRDLGKLSGFGIVPAPCSPRPMIDAILTGIDH
jgi:hypothetical protein